MKPEEIIQKYNLKNYTWIHKGAHSVLHTMFPASINLMKPLKDYWGDSFRIFVFFIIDNYLHWYYNEEDMTRLRKSFVEKINSDPMFITKFEADWRVLVDNFNDKCRKIDNTVLSGLSDAQLLKLYNELYKSYIREYAVAMGLLESFSMQVDLFFRPELENAIKGKVKDFNAAYSLLLSPVDDSFINREFNRRLKILQAMNEGVSDEEINGMLDAHAKRYFWIENNYAKMKVLKKEYFMEKIQQELKLGIDPDKEMKKMENQLKGTIAKKEQIIAELKLNENLKSIIKGVEVLARMQDDRKRCVLVSNHYQKLFMDEIGKRLGLNEAEMDYTIFPELEGLFAEKAGKGADDEPCTEIDKKRYAERKKASLCIETVDGYELFEGDTALDVFNEVFDIKAEAEEVKGTCASVGKVTGVVKIVRKTHDLASVNKGDILVASMTRPEMVVAMEKASGIITDEGGATCHAAVISRELKIPCITSTKTATKVFKNGDIVELDADKGIARKIK